MLAEESSFAQTLGGFMLHRLTFWIATLTLFFASGCSRIDRVKYERLYRAAKVVESNGPDSARCEQALSEFTTEIDAVKDLTDTEQERKLISLYQEGLRRFSLSVSNYRLLASERAHQNYITDSLKLGYRDRKDLIQEGRETIKQIDELTKQARDHWGEGLKCLREADELYTDKH